MKLPKSLQDKLANRIATNALRKLPVSNNLVDFASNDYLGFSKDVTIFQKSHQLLIDENLLVNGATGSRLLSGNHKLYEVAEASIAKFHQSDSALSYNSGYDANVGFFSAVPQRNDVILFDEFAHASIRDGVLMSTAKSFKFKHNDLDDLEKLLERFRANHDEIYIVTESVFSMDGDSPDLMGVVNLSEKHKAHLVIDEAHALGVFGKNGEGLVQFLNLQSKVFARIMTFGKGLGCHGAAILGSLDLKNYLINFSRSFIYTTALSPHAVATILIAYQTLQSSNEKIKVLQENSKYFNESLPSSLNVELFNSAIKSIIIPGNFVVKETAAFLQEKGFDVKPILSPTVPEGKERLRFCLHSYNTKKEITEVLGLLSEVLKKF
jgi:8-amino-7-oxononanoate synthase